MAQKTDARVPILPASAEELVIARHCPLCSAGEDQIVFSGRDTVFGTPGEWKVVRCRKCGMMYTNPAVAAECMAAYYPSEYPAHAPQTERSTRRHRDPWDRIPLGGKRRLLDVGCGSGGYLLRQQFAGWNVCGVEPSRTAVEVARAQGLDVVQGSIPGAKLSGREFEAIVMLGVLECLPDPMATLGELRTMLVSDGRLIVSVHNAGSTAARMFGPCWQGWDLPRHYSHFTPATLKQMLGNAGFLNVRLQWRRRSSRWRHSARVMMEHGRAPWHLKMASQSRQWASFMAAICSRGEDSDEIIAIAEG